MSASSESALPDHRPLNREAQSHTRPIAPPSAAVPNINSPSPHPAGQSGLNHTLTVQHNLHTPWAYTAGIPHSQFTYNSTQQVAADSNRPFYAMNPQNDPHAQFLSNQLNSNSYEIHVPGSYYSIPQTQCKSLDSATSRQMPAVHLLNPQDYPMLPQPSQLAQPFLPIPQPNQQLYPQHAPQSLPASSPWPMERTM